MRKKQTQQTQQPQPQKKPEAAAPSAVDKLVSAVAQMAKANMPLDRLPLSTLLCHPTDPEYVAQIELASTAPRSFGAQADEPIQCFALDGAQILPEVSERCRAWCLQHKALSPPGGRFHDPGTGRSYPVVTWAETQAVSYPADPLTGARCYRVGTEILDADGVDLSALFQNGWAARLAAAARLPEFAARYGAGARPPRTLIPTGLARVTIYEELSRPEPPSHWQTLMTAWLRAPVALRQRAESLLEHEDGQEVTPAQDRSASAPGGGVPQAGAARLPSPPAPAVPVPDLNEKTLLQQRLRLVSVERLGQVLQDPELARFQVTFKNPEPGPAPLCAADSDARRRAVDVLVEHATNNEWIALRRLLTPPR